MKYSDIAAGSSEGLRNVMRLLNSSPPDLTVKELREHVIKDILFSDYREKRTTSGRCHTHWKSRVYTILMEAPDLPEELLRKGVEKIFTNLEDRNLTEWTSKLWFVPNLPEDLKNKFLRLNHKHSCVSKEVKESLDRFLPVWLTTGFVSPFFEETAGVFLFSDADGWKLLDRNERGALLYICRQYANPTSSMVVLLPDVNGDAQGCAVEIEPLANTKTVHQAIAWMYQQNAQKWKGFDREV